MLRPKVQHRSRRAGFGHASRLLVLTPLLLLIGCSAARVEMTEDFPTPLVESLPYRVALVMDDEFRSFVYLEQDKKRRVGEVLLGDAQTKVFRNILNESFDVVVELNTPPEVNDFDLVFQPRVMDFQYALPSETKIDIYEVWVKYAVKITDHNDQLIADWPVTAYGKATGRTFSTTATVFKEAVIIAMRDLGVNLVVEMPREPGVQAWKAAREDPGGTGTQI